MVLEKLNDWLLSKALYDYNDKESTVVWRIKGWDKEYWYVEISWYYLTYLSYIYINEPKDVKVIVENAERIVTRLDKIVSKNFPDDFYTRYDLLNNWSIEKDWRNDLLFSFDIGMVIKWLNSIIDSWISNKLEIDIEVVLNRYNTILLNDISKDNYLLSHQRIRNNAIELPVKRSTTVDVHHLKTSSSLLSSSKREIDNSYEALIKNTRDYFQRPFADWKLNTDIHPTLYYVEWLLNYYYFKSDKKALEEAWEICNSILQKVDAEWKIRSNVKEWDSSYFRWDVVAQLLRALILLEHNWINISWNYDVLYNSLKNNFVYNQWEWVSFFPLDELDEKGLYQNTRVSMFTYQAMKLYQDSKEWNINNNSLNYII